MNSDPMIATRNAAYLHDEALRPAHRPWQQIGYVQPAAGSGVGGSLRLKDLKSIRSCNDFDPLTSEGHTMPMKQPLAPDFDGADNMPDRVV